MLMPYASSSKGNFYEVWDGHSRIMLECGLPPNKMRSLCGRPLTDYEACLITHEHGDHAKAAPHLVKIGVPIRTSVGTARALRILNTSASQVRTISSKDCTLAEAGYRIKAFAANHDAAEPLAYGIESIATKERLFFAVDTSYLTFTVEGFDEIAIECNYSDWLLDESSANPLVIERVRRNHMSAERCIDWLTKSDLSRTRLIWLLHISHGHGDAERFRMWVEQATGIQTKTLCMGAIAA